MKTANILGSSALALVALVAAAQAQDQELREVNVLTVNDDSCSPYPQFVGQEFGFYQEEGVKVNLLASNTTIPYVAFLSNGDADLVMLDPGQVLQAAQAGQPISVIYEAYQYAPEGIVVPADSDIQSMTGMKGKILGLASDRDRTTAALALDAVGLSIDDVTTVVVGESGPTIVSSFNREAIDGFLGGPSDRAQLQAGGFEYRDITPAEVNNNPGNSFVVNSDTKEEKRDLLESFLRAWAKAQHAGVLDTKAVMGACKKRVPEQWEDPAGGMRVVNNSVYNTQLRRTKNFGELQTDVWARMQPGLIKVGEIEGEIDPSTFLDDSFIAPANDFTTADVKKGIAEFKKNNPELVN